MSDFALDDLGGSEGCWAAGQEGMGEGGAAVVSQRAQEGVNVAQVTCGGEANPESTEGMTLQQQNG